VSALSVGFIANSGHWGSLHAPWYETVAILFVVILMTIAWGLIFKRLRRRQREPKPVSDHWQALRVMGEMCPRGWQAQITVYGQGAPTPEDAPPRRAPLVEVEWMQFDGEPRRPTIPRRAWARTISGALQMVVEDRRTDLTLDEIEPGAFKL
jgi:hypothetical protein